MRPQRRDAIPHHLLVKLAQAERGAAYGLHVVPQLEHRHLAQEVAAVGRVVGATFGFLPRRRGRQVRARLEERRRLVHRPLASVQADPREQPADARERFARLCHAVARVIGAETFVEHHLFGVVCPAVLARRRLRERVEANPDATNLPRRLPHEHAVHVVARHHFVRADDRERRDVELLQPRLLSRRLPGGLRVGHVEVTLHRRRLEGRRRVHGGEAQIERRRRGHDHALARRQRHEPLLDDERLQRVHRLLRCRHEGAARRVVRQYLLPDGERRPPRVHRRRGLHERGLLHAEFPFADGDERLDRQVDELFGAVARFEAGLPHRERRVGPRQAFGLEPAHEGVDLTRCRGRGSEQSALEGGVSEGGERQRHVARQHA